MKRYRTMTNVKSVDDPDHIAEQIGWTVGYSRADEERILPSRSPEGDDEPEIVLTNVDGLFEPGLDEMDGPSTIDLAEIDQEAA